MAILQVNVRPASRLRRFQSFRRGELASAISRSGRNVTGSPGNHSSPVDITQAPSETDPQKQTPLWQRVVWTLIPGTTIGRAIVSATQRLEEAGSDTAHLDAQVILAHILGVERSWLFAHYDYRLNPNQASQYTELVARRASAEPVAYIVGRKEFYGLEFLVDRRVLIPRPETELLVDAVLDHIALRADKAVRMVDVGTGSGAIALAVAANCPDAQVFAVDLSQDALKVARLNVARMDTRSQVTLLQGDMLDVLPGKVDIIAANLPYIASDDYNCLDAGVRDYEPQLALEAGPEGLDAIEDLLQQAQDHLSPGGVMFLEIGHNQGDAVLKLVEHAIPNAGYVGLREDYHGHDRLVVVAV